MGLAVGNNLIFIYFGSVSDHLWPRVFVSGCMKINDSEILVILSSLKPSSRKTIQQAVSIPARTDCWGRHIITPGIPVTGVIKLALKEIKRLSQ